MKNQTKNSLIEFYFGSLEESKRLKIEKDLLIDSEMLLDYFDIKREMESAEKVPSKPSDFLWHRLKPLTKRRAFRYAAAASLLAACLAGVYFLNATSQIPKPVVTEAGILFDSSAEHSFTSSVL